MNNYAPPRALPDNNLAIFNHTTLGESLGNYMYHYFSRTTLDAAARGVPLLTRNIRRYHSRFPKLKLISP